MAAREHANTAIRGSGIIEVTQVDVAFEVAGRMIERSVDEGAMVDKGEPVGRLDDREYRLRVVRASAAKDAADARYRMMAKGAREQRSTGRWRRARPPRPSSRCRAASTTASPALHAEGIVAADRA